MLLRRSETAGITAGAISAGRICKWQGSVGAAQAAAGGSGPPDMMPGWPPRSLAHAARTGVVLGWVKGGHRMRAQSRRWQQQLTWVMLKRETAAAEQRHGLGRTCDKARPYDGMRGFECWL